MRGVWFVVLVLLVPIHKTLTIEDGKVSKGIIFNEKGALELSGKEYYVLMTVDVRGLQDMIRPIDSAITKVKKGLKDELQLLRSLPNRIEMKGNRDQQRIVRMTVNITKTLEDHLHFLSNDLEDRQRSLNDFLISMGNINLSHEQTRNKRGLCDGCGSLLNFVFGLTTDTQLRATNEALERFAELSEAERNMINIHSDILNSSTIQMEEIEKSVDKVTICLGRVVEDISTLNNHLETIQNNEFLLANTLTLMSALTYAGTALADLSNNFINMKLGITEFQKGFLSSYLVPPNVIMEIVTEIQGRGLKNLFPPIEKYLSVYYKFVRVIQLPHDNLSFLLRIPLEGQPSIKLRLFEIVNIPQPVGERLVMSFANLPKFLAVSDDLSLYMELEDLSDCRLYEKLYVCSITNPVYRSKAPSCALDIFKGKLDSQLCEKNFSPDLMKPLVHKSPIGWIYSSSISQELTISCSGNIKSIEIPVGYGKLNLEESCRLSSEYYMIPSSTEHHGLNRTKRVDIV